MARNDGFASTLRALRAKEDMTQAELARQIGVDKSTIINWESGEYMPNLRIATTLADIFGVTLEQLVGRA